MKMPVILLPVALMLLPTSCKKTEAVPQADTLKKVWTAQTVQENSTTVYTKGGSSNIRNYAGYRLDLSAPPAVTLTEVDGSRLTGQYEVQGTTRLILTGLVPQPTGSNGRLEYAINSLSGTTLSLSQTTQNPKTGSTQNTYTLANP